VKTAKEEEAKVAMPYGEMFSEMEKQLAKGFLIASEEIKNVFNKAREDVRRAASR